MTISNIDPNFRLPMLQNQSDRSDVQTIKETSAKPLGAEDPIAPKTTTETFLEFARMNPTERIRAAYLKEQGITEEGLAAMPREERDKIEEEIRQLIEQKVKQGMPNAGVGLDIKA